MLTDGDRSRLAPYLAKIHAARSALTEARLAAAQAQKNQTDFKRGSTLWDRWFNRDGPIGVAYRETRKASAAARDAVDARRKELDAAEAALDRQLTDMMPHINPRHDENARLIERCGHAIAECRALREPIRDFVTIAREAVSNGPDEKAARQGYPHQLQRARDAAGTLRRALQSIPGSGLSWNAAALDRLPTTADNVSALHRLKRELTTLQRMPSSVDRLRMQLTELQRKTVRAQHAARIQVRDQLIEESGRG